MAQYEMKIREGDEFPLVTDTNLGQRDEILPSERAKAYQMKISVLKAQGKRNDLIREIMNESQKNE